MKRKMQNDKDSKKKGKAILNIIEVEKLPMFKQADSN